MHSLRTTHTLVDTPRADAPHADIDSVVVIGKESVGKSQLIASLTGLPTYSSNFRGVTLSCDVYRSERFAFIDTPGILVGADTLTTRAALAKLATSDVVLLVVRGTHIDADLADLLPLARGTRGAVVVTFWDKVPHSQGTKAALSDLSRSTGLAFIPVDSRRLTAADREAITSALDDAHPIVHDRPAVRVEWRIEPPLSVFEYRVVGPLAASMMLLLPAAIAVTAANEFAAIVAPFIEQLSTAASLAVRGVPQPIAEILVGRYGLITMGPLLFVWSVPTVLVFAVMLGVYKSSGLIDRITSAVHPLTRACGLTGRDVIRIIMGFGCNVPAVINTRACTSATRGTCVSAIAFGSACSYQFGATLAVFGAAGKPALVIPYLAFLLMSTLMYTTLTAPRRSRASLTLLHEGRAFLEWPRPGKVWQESRGTVWQFFQLAIPLFLIIAVVASLLNSLGLIALTAQVLEPLMAVFRLPAEAALPVTLASIRKDGILLFADPALASSMSAGQLLTGVYLAGVLLPCLVTALTIAKEQSPRFVIALLAKQAGAALLFTMALAWLSAAFGV